MPTHATFPQSPGSTKFLREDGQWVVPAGGSDAFPVGSVFISVVSTNPGTLLGYGTWVAFGAGRMLVGIDAGQTEFDTVEETGGSKTHTLTTSEMPSHTHTQDAHNHTQDAHNHTQNAHNHGVTDPGHVHAISCGTTDGSVGRVDSSSSAQAATFNTNSATTGLTVNNATATNQAATATNQAATATNQNTGGGGAHNNLPPYIVVYMWKRTA